MTSYRRTESSAWTPEEYFRDCRGWRRCCSLRNRRSMLRPCQGCIPVNESGDGYIGGGYVTRYSMKPAPIIAPHLAPHYMPHI